MPGPCPAFDASLHLKALHAPEGGLLYRNARTPHEPEDGYATGILVPVGDQEEEGFVLAGYSKDWGRSFSELELARFMKATEELARFLG